MSDPVSRLALALQEIDKTFGSGYAAANPDVVSAVVQSAASDWAASRIAVAIENVAVALLAEDEPAARPPGIVRASGLVR